METETELPRNAVRRLVKGKLDAMAAGAEVNFSVNKEVRARRRRRGRFPSRHARGGISLSPLLRGAGPGGGPGPRSQAFQEAPCGVSPSRLPPRPRWPPPAPPPAPSGGGRRAPETKTRGEGGPLTTATPRQAVHAFAEAGRIFIHFITAGAQEICDDKKRQTIGTQDVLDALEGFQFGEMVAPLQESLEGYRRITKERNERRYETVRKRKAKQAALDAEAAGEGGATPAKQAKAGGEGGEGAAEGEAAPAPADGD